MIYTNISISVVVIVTVSVATVVVFIVIKTHISRVDVSDIYEAQLLSGRTLRYDFHKQIHAFQKTNDDIKW